MNVLNVAKLNSAETKILNKIADEIKEDFTLFIDEICARCNNEAYLWALPLVSRNVSIDDTFLKICHIELAVRLVDKNCIEKIIVPFDDERVVLSGILKNIEIKSVENQKPLSALRGRVNYAIDRINFIKETKKKSEVAKLFKCNVNQPVNLIFTPALSSCFSGGEYHDRYYTGLISYCGNDTYFMPEFIKNNNNMSINDLIETAAKTKEYKFLFYETYLDKADYREIYKYLQLCRRLRKEKYMYKGWDISSIIYSSLKKGEYNKPSYIGILQQRALLHMKESGIEIKSSVIWYEGRPNDIMVAASIRELYTDKNCTGYIGLAADEFSLGLFLSDYQNKTAHGPGIMAIPGKMYREMATQFCKDLEIRYVPILRSDFLVKKRKKQYGGKKKLLLLLPYFEELIQQLIQGVISYLSVSEEEVELIVKNHPVNAGRTLEDYYDETINVNPVYIDGNLEDALPDMDVVVTANTSASLEIVCAGVPLIILCQDGELHHARLPLGELEAFYSIAYGVEETVKALSRFMQRESIDNSNIRRLLSEKNKENILKIFG